MYIRNAWYVAAWSKEIGLDKPFSRKLFGKNVVLFRAQDGALSALDDRCGHRAAPLSCGRIENGNIRCMYHGLVFTGAGDCVEVPGQSRISPLLRVRSYPVAERDGLVWIWPGDPALADVNHVFRVESHESAAWRVELGRYSHFDASYDLVADNLLDFSHLAFVHQGSIGNPEIAFSRPQTEKGDDWIRIRHWMPDIEPPPSSRAMTKLPARVDRLQTYTWYVRGNIFDQTSCMAPAGTGGMDSPAPEAVKKRTCIAVTPETETTCHYFWSSAHNDYLTDIANVTKVHTDRLAEAFEEDRSIIEAQQRSLLEFDSMPMQIIGVDVNALEARRMVERIVAAEKGGEMAVASARRMG